jgi:hypothetical protein
VGRIVRDLLVFAERGTIAAASAYAKRSPKMQSRRVEAWEGADLMRRVFAIDVLRALAAGGLPFIATIEEPRGVAIVLSMSDCPRQARP